MIHLPLALLKWHRLPIYGREHNRVRVKVEVEIEVAADHMAQLQSEIYCLLHLYSRSQVLRFVIKLFNLLSAGILKQLSNATWRADGRASWLAGWLVDDAASEASYEGGVCCW